MWDEVVWISLPNFLNEYVVICTTFAFYVAAMTADTTKAEKMTGKRDVRRSFFRRLKKRIKLFFAPKWVREYQKFDRK